MVVRCLDRHLDVVRVALLEAGRGDPDEATAHLQLGDRTRAADRTPGVQILPQRVQSRRPIHAPVRIKALIFGSNEGLLQEERDLV